MTRLRFLLGCLLLVAAATASEAAARSAQARIARVSTAVATLDGVRVRLDWPAQAREGVLSLQAARVEAPELGYRFHDLQWRCPLRRDGARWRCEGDVRAGRGRPLRLAIELDDARTAARLHDRRSAIRLRRDAATPELTRIELARVPLAWAQALLAQAWAAPRLSAGSVDGRLDVIAPSGADLRVEGPLRIDGAALDTPDGRVAAEGVGAAVELRARFGERATRVGVAGAVRGGELLFGNAYLALQRRRVAFALEAERDGEGPWRLPRLHWDDPGVLRVDGRAVLGADAGLRALDVGAAMPDLRALRDGYLSGFLGVAGLADLRLAGAAAARLRYDAGALHEFDLRLDGVAVDDPQGRFRVADLAGDVRFSSAESLRSELRWQGGELHGLDFGAARLPLLGERGELRLADEVAVPLLGGRARLAHMRLRPPADGRGLELNFGLDLERLDIARLAAALQWPPFAGELTGHIPQARYADDRLEFEGGLAVHLFGGAVQVSSLAMERPFGVAPTLSADIAFDDIDLQSLTGVLGFGSITGKLDGEVAGLRLVDWTPVAFDARLRTDRAAARRAGVRQRISQRAVQDLSSVSDASFMGSLQARLIGLFDDFGYARLGIGCRLAEQVCEMDGLGSAGPGFIIVAGAGLPRLSVIGFNRRVDWPTLLERLAAAGSGDVKPVFE
ncbi:hypothetical protein [Vulcaniibacterium tengchongense]|uniref:Dicarboxylate transport n=1 Tax=Vulcaniibacterium tengchongense TaxID=1273429 RepID=A0A3N4V4W6_9GAMM|nr:hypothetical protein [Vulcaniibacterium tengchongense]RPE77093.1 hypothetical protein EDC50_2350 [Vulcaniibacterium tengchongense]